MSSSESRTDSYLRVGALKRPHGLRGAIAVEPIGDFPEQIHAGARVVAVGGAPAAANGSRIARTSLEIEWAHRHGTHILVKFSGRDSIDDVAALSGMDLVVPRASLARPSDDFLFDDEVAAFSCVTPGGKSLGRAEAFERHGPAVYLRVVRDGATFLVPFVHPIVCEVSRHRREIVLDPPDGLFEV